jgi:hypothetical protein
MHLGPKASGVVQQAVVALGTGQRCTNLLLARKAVIEQARSLKLISALAAHASPQEESCGVALSRQLSCGFRFTGRQQQQTLYMAPALCLKALRWRQLAQQLQTHLGALLAAQQHGL